MNDIKFLVRVQCDTYNHALYIVDAMNGFTIQETNFPYLCIIIDDASTDGEPEVIRQYLHDNFVLDDALITQQDETEEFVRVFSRHKNNLNCYFLVVFLKYNHYSIKKPKGPYYIDWVRGIKYIAMCEGDDYWIEPKKLQKQFDYMNSHPTYSLCHTSFKMRRGIENDLKTDSNIHKRVIELQNNHSDLAIPILNGIDYRIQTVTTFVRRDFLLKAYKILSPYKNMFLMGDTQLWFVLSRIGEVGYLEDQTSVYRIHLGSASRTGIAESHYRFQLSCYEMIVTMARLYSLPQSYQDEVNAKYIRHLIYYKSFVPKYKVFVKVEYRNHLEHLKYLLMTSCLFRYIVRMRCTQYYKKIDNEK